MNDLSFEVLHLSDLHFGSLRRPKDFKNHFRDNWDKLSEAIARAVKGNKVQMVVISGDMVCDGSDEHQYEVATKFVEKLLKDINLDSSKLLVVPGNHDLNRSIVNEECENMIYVSLFNSYTYLE